jgi:hypothetical protein
MWTNTHFCGHSHIRYPVLSERIRLGRRHTGVSRQQNLCSLELAGGVPASPQQGRQFFTFARAKRNTISYIHLISPFAVRDYR